MSIELVMMDMDDPKSASDILMGCAEIMPTGFFSRLAICFPKTDFKFPENVDHIQCSFQKGNMFGYNVWLVREFPRFIVCDHCLIIHRDGYILNPEKWTDEFLKYDYCGAPWDRNRNGGNGGFSLVSKRFALWYARHPFPIEDGVAHDCFVCETISGTAKSAGFKYAPLHVNLKWSLELQIDGYPRNLNDVFGFHGKWYIQ